MSFPNTITLSEEQVLEISATQENPMGTRAMTEDGRVFRYAQASATDIKANRLCISVNETKGGLNTATDQRLYDNYAVGTTMIQVYLSTMTTAGDTYPVNFFKDGYMFVNSTDVAAYQFCQIDSNVALSSATAALGTAAANNTIYLKKPGLKKVGDTDTGSVHLTANPYKGVSISTVANGPGIPLGINPVAVTASYYFWLQTWGPAIAPSGEGVGLAKDKYTGAPLFWSTAIAGCAGGRMTASASGYIADDTDSGFAANLGKIGNIMIGAPADNMYHMVNLTLAP